MTSYYENFLSPEICKKILELGRPVEGINGLEEIGQRGELETTDALRFMCELYENISSPLENTLNQRIKDREFIDSRTRSLMDFNSTLKLPLSDPDYKTVLGLQDSNGRIVFGPKSKDYYQPRGGHVKPIPEHLQGAHVTLFGPPKSAKLAINAMNCFHRKIDDEPKILTELVDRTQIVPLWGADDEDSKTPLRSDLNEGEENLSLCFNGTLRVDDKKSYHLEKTHLARPIKRIPGLALPSTFLFYKKKPLPLHVYDFAIHFFHHWDKPKALSFYIPKLENEEEAAYLKMFIESAEKLIQKQHPSYNLGTVRLMIVLENPRAIFRINEIMDELHPYFAGASLGWHDFLASTARLFKEDPNYRIPVKADPNIVIKYIKSSHEILAQVVGLRGGIKIGGMYGVLPSKNSLSDPSFQIAIKGLIKDVITQLKRGLDGFWIAHPDFVRIGIGLTQAWKEDQIKGTASLEILVRALLSESDATETMKFINGADIQSLSPQDPCYDRSLIVANVSESSHIANNHPDEIRYNIFQTLQYLADWLCGNGCVALPAKIDSVPVRIMDDLATTERSRFEVWHEIYHKRFSLEEFIKIAHEEFHYIKKDFSKDGKIVQVKWNSETQKWYDVAFRVMIKLMTDKKPVEFATEYLLPFTDPTIRNSLKPWDHVCKIDFKKFGFDGYVERLLYYFDLCGSISFAKNQAKNLIPDYDSMEQQIKFFSLNELLEAMSFHGDIGEHKKTLDAHALSEQQDVHENTELQVLAQTYLKNFGFKFLVSAKGKNDQELLAILKNRIGNSKETEIEIAKDQLWTITKKRAVQGHQNTLKQDIQSLVSSLGINAVQISLLYPEGSQQLCLGDCKPNTYFQIASLSKSVASCFALEYFSRKNISIDTKVNDLLSKTVSSFRIPLGDHVTLKHLLSHTALNMHYVQGIPLDEKMPPISALLKGNDQYGYPPISVINEPGTKFQYSGGGFLVLEQIIESLEGKPITAITKKFIDTLGMNQFTFDPKNQNDTQYATGFYDDGSTLEGKRKMFPSFAAGAMATSASVAKFLKSLENSYQHNSLENIISHDTARSMLFGQDQGSQKFMGADMGFGIFVCYAKDNVFMLHQGANDGFRALFLHCFHGPDKGKGLVILANGELQAVTCISLIAQKILHYFQIQGIHFENFTNNFRAENITSENIVNFGYKKLLLDNFEKRLPEKNLSSRIKDPLADFNILVDSEILDVSNEGFARAQNLLSPYIPEFDPTLFGKEGKIMDSWETVRHNIKGRDFLHLKLKHVADVNYVSISTMYHLGNHAPIISVSALTQGTWKKILEKCTLLGHATLKMKLDVVIPGVSEVLIEIFPDGGLTRLGLYSTVPNEHLKDFAAASLAKCIPYQEPIPAVKKPLSIAIKLNDELIKKNLQRLKHGEEFNNASSLFGAKVLFASNEHYSPASQVISPFAPINMFDGLESARSREVGHKDEVIIKLARSLPIHRIEMDFTFFVNNNPYDIILEGKHKDQWITLIPKTFVKPFAGNIKIFPLNISKEISEIKLSTIPDGGMNRIRVFSFFTN